jgi:CheY-like chemotaxis protein
MSVSESPRSAAAAGQGPLGVLCVDDSEEILVICRTILEAAGYQVFTASNGPLALEMLKMHPVRLAIIDSVMPGMSGTELAREIKRTSADIRVIMFTSSDRPEESTPFIDSYVSKGRGPLALRDLVRTLLKK